jgi:lysophospholipase L1-like esterase
VTCGLLALVIAAPAAASDRDRDDAATYLALGDSVAFGFNPLALGPNPPFDPRNAANFVGYPEALGERLELNVTNASCPGEASGGFISLTGVDNSCRPYRSAFPLHVDYKKTSQLDFAVAFLKAHPRTRLVTLDIGANDLFVLQRQCGGNVPCIQAGLPGVLSALSANLGTIYSRIRGEAHYHHELVGLTYYLSNYNDKDAVNIISAINAVVAKATLAADGEVANGFTAFKKIAARSGGDSCAAGLLIVISAKPLKCDIHPSPHGRDVLATAVQRALEHEGDD